MANNQNLKPRWKPGQSGNPSGCPKIPDSLRAISSLSRNEIIKIVSKYARMTRSELQAAAIDQDTPMIEVAVASIFAQSAKNGDYQRLAFLLDRAGLQPKPVEATDEESEALEEIRRLTTSELVAIVKELPGFEKP